MSYNYLEHFNTQLTTFLETQTIPANRMKEAIHYTLFPGGKRLRPLLVYLTGALFDLPLSLLDPLAMAIEMVHTYSLVHDDLPAMDNDDMRRGKPSCHRAFDEATAILTGDALHTLAVLVLTQHPHPMTPAFLKILFEAVGPAGMISGQSLDLTELMSTETISTETLTWIHDLKTTTLIQACVRLPLLAAEPPAIEKMALETFARHFGLAFQMQNDYLDKYNVAALGKTRHSDELQDKQTFATRYSEEALRTTITTTLQVALNALAPFQTRSQALVDFTLRQIQIPSVLQSLTSTLDIAPSSLAQ